MERLLLLFGLSAIACSDVTNLRNLAKALDREFDDTEVRVALTDQIILTVTVTDSALVLASCETQVGVAMRVGRFLPGRYPEVAALQVVNVAFAPDDMGEVPLRNAHLPIRFSPQAIEAGLQPHDSGAAVASCRAFEELNAP